MKVIFLCVCNCLFVLVCFVTIVFSQYFFTRKVLTCFDYCLNTVSFFFFLGTAARAKCQ